MKRPSFQFYPGDWLRDTALRSCSLGARGLWMDMICFMHEGTPYGHLKVNHKVILPANLARMVGETLEVVEGYLKELFDAGVFMYDESSGIYSKRMVRDEEIRRARADGGKLGGNPSLTNPKDNHKVNLPYDKEVDEKDKQKSTPSSSSSSSSSKVKIEVSEKPEDVCQQVWDDFIKLRRAKNSPLTETALSRILIEANKSGMSLNDALSESIMRGWTGFKASWIPKSTDVHLSSTDDALASAK